MGSRLAVIGAAGCVGSAAAFRLAERGCVSEVIMIDPREELARSHAMDIEQGVSEVSSTFVRFGTWPDLEGCDVAVMAAAAPVLNPAMSVEERIASNTGIVREVASQIGRYGKKAVIITLTNPMDIINYSLYSLSGLEARQFVGFSWNDTLRFRYAVSRLLNAPVSEVEAPVLGEHGELKVHLFDRVMVRSKPVSFTAEQEKGLGQSMRDWFSTFARLSGDARTSGWTCAMGIPRIVEAVLTGSGEIFNCSAVLNGQYGLADVSVGVPVRLGRDGVKEVVELSLTAAQDAALKAAAKKIRGLASRLTGR